MKEWKKQLDKYNSLVELLAQRKESEESLLRFGRCSVRASDVGSQYYCERKVELEYLYGEVETETKNQGTEGHESLLEGTEALDQEELWKAVYGKEPVLACEWLLLAEYSDVILVGQPDSILFEDGYPLVIFEYKFSRSKMAYPSYHAQAGFYGLLLKNLGFDTGKLFYAIVVADRNARDDPNLKYNVVEAITKNGSKNAVLSIQNAIIYLNRFDEQEAKASLDWVIQFWKGQREAISTTNPNKCKICEYQEECKNLIF